MGLLMGTCIALLYFLYGLVRPEPMDWLYLLMLWVGSSVTTAVSLVIGGTVGHPPEPFPKATPYGRASYAYWCARAKRAAAALEEQEIALHMLQLSEENPEEQQHIMEVLPILAGEVAESKRVRDSLKLQLRGALVLASQPRSAQ